MCDVIAPYVHLIFRQHSHPHGADAAERMPFILMFLHAHQCITCTKAEAGRRGYASLVSFLLAVDQGTQGWTQMLWLLCTIKVPSAAMLGDVAAGSRFDCRSRAPVGSII